MNSREFASRSKHLAAKNREFGTRMSAVPSALWPQEITFAKSHPVGVWRSRDFLAVAYAVPGDPLRLSVQRTSIKRDGNWQDGIRWDDLQRVKGECGFHNTWAMEVYPPDSELVNVANIRHLWIVPQPPFAWARGGAA